MKELQWKIHTNRLHNPSSIEWIPAKYPLFATPDPNLRALIALSMGCDVFDGVHNFGIGKIDECLNDSKKKDKPLTLSLKDEMIKRMKSLDYSILDTLVSAMLYEPGLVDTNQRVQTTYENNECINEGLNESYIHTPPTGYRFPTFIQSFFYSKQSTRTNRTNARNRTDSNRKQSSSLLL